MTRHQALLMTVVCLVALNASAAGAQSTGRPGRIEIAVGPRWTSGLSLAAGDANETTPSGAAFRLFTASTTLASATSFDARVGVRITRRLEAQVSASYGAPRLRISVSNDAENAAAVTSTERIQQFALRGGASWSPSPLDRWRLAPFVTGEAGYLRELHEAHTLVQTGRVVEIGGGTRYPFRSSGSGRFREIGARVDVRAVLRSKGVVFDDRVHVTPAIGASLYLRF